MKAHERVCGRQEQSEEQSFDTFLASLKLHKSGHTISKRECKPNERPRASNYERFMDIDLASPLGKYIVDSSHLSISEMNPASRGYKSLGMLLSPQFVFQE